MKHAYVIVTHGLLGHYIERNADGTAVFYKYQRRARLLASVRPERTTVRRVPIVDGQAYIPGFGIHDRYYIDAVKMENVE